MTWMTQAATARMERATELDERARMENVDRLLGYEPERPLTAEERAEIEATLDEAAEKWRRWHTSRLAAFERMLTRAKEAGDHGRMASLARQMLAEADF